MRVRLMTFASALFLSPPVWAVVALPLSGVHSVAGDISNSDFFPATSFVPSTSVTGTAGQTASIALSTYSAQAKTTPGSNHVHAQASGFDNGAFAVANFSGWYDQITITGGTGTGTAQFSVQLNGVVTAGAYLGIAGYGLLASPVHPTQLISDTPASNLLNTSPWDLDSDQLTEIAVYNIVASPYNDPDQLAGLFAASSNTNVDIPADPGPPDQAEYVPDLVLTPGANQAVNVTLTGSFTFTYGEAFYLIGVFESGIADTGALAAFEISETPGALAAVDGSGPTLLDFFNSARLTSVVLPHGTSFSSASGTAYTVTAVPEPGEWLMLLAGLGLIGWRVRRRA